MATQLQLDFDQQKLKLMRCILVRIDQKELIKGLSALFFNFMEIQKKGLIRDESNHQ